MTHFSAGWARKPWRRVAALCVSCLVCATQPAAAFDSGEHERMADSALLLAFAYRLEQAGHGSMAADDDICRRILAAGYPQAILTLFRHCSPVPEAITYGGISRLVDELNYPSQLFVREGTLSDRPEDAIAVLPGSWEDLNEHFRVRHDNRGDDGRFGRALDGVRALSYNEVHFQNELAQQMQRMRRDALLAAQESLYSALVSNALSDHFLQDFFAPGHLLWPRSQSHDSVAVSLHDGTNQRGARFRLDVDFWKYELKPIADFLDALPGESRSYQLLDAYWLQRRADAAVTCGDDTGDGTLAGNPREGVACLRKHADGDGIVLHYGDGLLSRSPGQQALMLLVEAERILQLLRAHDPSQDFRAMAPVPEMRSFSPGYEIVIVPCPQHEFGHYLFHPLSCEPLDFSDDGDFDRAGDIADAVFEDSVRGVFLFAMGGQSPFRNVGSARYQLALEHIPLGLMANSARFRNSAIHKPPAHCLPFSPCNTGFAYGIDYLHDGDFTARGVGLRLIKAFPSVSLQLSPYVKHLKYHFGNDDDWNLSWGLRLDWGFSIGSLYVALGKEYYVNDSAVLESTGMASFGLGIGLPQSRIRKWARDNPAYRPVEDLSVPAR